LWESARPPRRRLIDLFAGTVTAIFFGLFAWVMVGRLPSVIDSNQVTNDLALPLWPFFLAALLGVVACAAVALIRLVRTAGGAGGG
jgi:TRAP-type C4-dicarboxylate transport system permease small subunit